VKSVFQGAIDAHTPEDWESYLDSACGGDSALRGEVMALLRAHQSSGSLPDAALPAAEFNETVALAVSERPGAVIGPYKLLDQIGQGGMGVVFLAEQTQPVRRAVALKIIKPGMDTRQVIARFEAERQALAMMDHPNIARVFDAGSTAPASGYPGRPYFVMELVKGVPITKYCDEKQLSIRARLELLLTVCRAVQHAHQKGVIHRDLKPSNVLVAEFDGRPVPKIIDFGLAKATGPELTDRTMFTQYGQIVGTFEYMSPEQARFNQLDIDTRTDIYSLGVLLYELLTGETPFDRRRLRTAAFDEMLRIIRDEDPPTPSTRLGTSDTLSSIAANRHTEPARLSREIRGELDWIVMKCLEKDRNRRYETINGLATDLQHYLRDEPVSACPPSAAYRLRKFVRRNRTAVAVTAMILFVTMLMGAGAGWAMRSRNLRQAALEQGVRSAIDEVKDWHGRENWTEAKAAVKRAEGLLAAGAPAPELEQTVHRWRTDLDAVARLEEIRLAYQNSEQEGWDFRRSALAGYEKEFRALGIDIDTQPEGDAASTVRAQPIRSQLIEALDDWAHVRANAKPDGEQTSEKDTATWRMRPLVVARAADVDGTFRNRVRTALISRDPKDITELARSSDAPHLPASTLALLAQTVTDRDLAITLLSQAQHAHADDFRINMMLAGRLIDIEGSEVTKLYDRKELVPMSAEGNPGVAYATAAVALRPENGWAWATLGTAQYVSRRIAESSAAYREAVRLKPDFFGAYINLSRNLYQQGELSEAVEASRRAIAINPNIPEAHTNLGIGLFEQGHYDDAVAALHKAIEIRPNFATAHSNLGTILRSHGEYDKAIEEFQLALKLRPDDADDYASLGLAFQNRGDAAEAVAACRKAIAIEPDLAVAYSNLALALRDQGNKVDALAALQKAIELRPDHATTYCELGTLFEELGQPENAIEAYRKSIELSPKASCSYSRLGAILLNRRELDEAVEVFRAAARLEPENATLHSNLGIALKELGQFEEAIAVCRHAIELAPDSAAAVRSLGNVLHARGTLGDAIATFQKAIALEPNYVEAHVDLGEALEDNGQLEEALAVDQKVIELDPKSTSGHNNLASVLYTLDRTDEAVAALRKAIELSPKEAIVHLNLGMMLSSQNKFDEAAEALRKSIELQPNNPDAQATLGEVLALSGDLPEAAAAYEKAIELAPNNPGPRGDLSWLLATWVDPKLRDAARAIELAEKAVELAPENGRTWNSLGVARYRAAQWQPAIDALKKSIELEGEGDAVHCFFLAMAQWQLGERDAARKYYDQAVAWIEKNAVEHPMLVRFRAEADKLLGIVDEKPTTESQPRDDSPAPENLTEPKDSTR
jgi:tetratricopeptide (TPR) repeat protein/serine/threonine protein kinase